ncbi:hypothetical protein CLOHYLEM_04887 [[Clostridium] hylemonae DSM 15053]|uniref:Uncharacterized protein n=1 Tax=[Clostridium] hylemonae DSM 15053 TaxID=553973 RepID=C0BYJ8_9FIRM|nr:hypothetical protein CLOHYLEM_04887 [[Clostridium] hylemonae DSM 15053]
MNFKSVFLFNILLYHFLCDFRFRLIFLCPFTDLIQRLFTFAFSEF